MTTVARPIPVPKSGESVSARLIEFTSKSPVHIILIIISIIWLTVMLALLRKRARRTYRWINLAGKPR